MARITREGFEACMAFGTASLAVAKVARLIVDQLPDDRAQELFGELEAAHDRLRDLFAQEEDAAVLALALSILVLVDRTGEQLRSGRHLPGS